MSNSHSLEESKKMVKIAVEALENTKGEDIEILDISEVSSLGDYFIIANGTNRSQIQAMADRVEEELYKAGYKKKDIEGYESAFWILQDFEDIIVHIFDKENRVFYDLERIWRDGKKVTKEEI
ncbi:MULTISPECIES: ribosome silencing factor [unclassified Butyrivibrio]|jgi:ribosome-associated protein|uniref:ribosome silencing factor n=1 Tax=unclassified Butyrivibrio TaxID=2639466 RepID=UPI0004176BF4|nr:MULTISPECIES: ribosome silencing factor [unclassified Butyrivibrio]